MIPYELDPSLHSSQPHEPKLDDGFSRPDEADTLPPTEERPAEATIGEKSAF